MLQFGERVGRGGGLIGPKLFWPEAYLSCASSKLCKFILIVIMINLTDRLLVGEIQVHVIGEVPVVLWT